VRCDIDLFGLIIVQQSHIETMGVRVAECC
jgi:hypothetical protein